MDALIKYNESDLKRGNYLGGGSYGKVFLCIDREGETKALKCMEKSEKHIKDIVREICILSELDHPNICKFHGILLNKPHEICMVLDFYELGDIYKMIQRDGPLCEKTAAEYTLDIASALQYCHERNIYHRDIKPENMIVGRDGFARLCDFGFAVKVSKENRLRKSLYGTIDYVCPEMLLKTSYDEKVDIWSLGTVIYEMVEGTPPFYNDSVEKTYSNIMSCKIMYPKHFSNELTDLLKHMIVLTPSMRFSASEVIQHEWLKINDSSESTGD